MPAAYLGLAALVLFVLGYRFYSCYLSERLFNLAG